MQTPIRYLAYAASPSGRGYDLFWVVKAPGQPSKAGPAIRTVRTQREADRACAEANCSSQRAA